MHVLAAESIASVLSAEAARGAAFTARRLQARTTLQLRGTDTTEAPHQAVSPAILRSRRRLAEGHDHRVVTTT